MSSARFESAASTAIFNCSLLYSKEQLKIAVEAADSKRAEDIIALDVRNVSLLADYFMICSANSERQINAITQQGNISNV